MEDMNGCDFPVDLLTSKAGTEFIGYEIRAEHVGLWNVRHRDGRVMAETALVVR